MTKPKTIAQKLVGLHQKICNVKGVGERLPLMMRFNSILYSGIQTADLVDDTVHYTFHDGSVLSRKKGIFYGKDEFYAGGGGGNAMTDTKHPTLSIVCILLLASTVDWMADLIAGVL